MTQRFSIGTVLLITLVSTVFFHEPLDKRKIAGLAIILVSVILLVAVSDSSRTQIIHKFYPGKARVFYTFHIWYQSRIRAQNPVFFQFFEPPLSNFTECSRTEKSFIDIFSKKLLTTSKNCGIYISGDGRHPSVKSAP